MVARFIFWFKNTLLLLKTLFQLLRGMWHISKYKPPFVSIFGGARLKQTDFYALKAHELSQRLVNANVSVLTGGGPGIMEAANCGLTYAPTGTARSIGIGVRDLGEPFNICVQDYMQVNEFWARKWLLTRYSTAFIVFPGGFGTLDELSEVLTLMQTHKVARMPIVLVGVEYWKPFMEWCTTKAFHHGTITKEDLDLLLVTDDLEEVFQRTVRTCAACKT
jgi:uncharacterized protein (TIGR00730 family)